MAGRGLPHRPPPHGSQPGRGTNPHPGLGRLIRFAWATRRYYLASPPVAPAAADPMDDGAITRAATYVWLRRYNAKVTRCRTAKDVDNFLRDATQGMRVA